MSPSSQHEALGSVIISPTNSSQSPSAPRRIACDRCHGQKLKCPRDITSKAACTRCAKAGAVCQVSPARATGRPAKHPKQQNQHRRSASSISSKSSKSSAAESSNTIEPEIKTPVTPPQSTNDPSPFIAPSAESCFLTSSVPYMPFPDETMNFYPTSGMHFDAVDMPDETFPGALNFDYNDGSGFLDFGSSIPTMMPPSAYRKSSAPAALPSHTSHFGAMPPPPTPSMAMSDEMPDVMSTAEETNFARPSSTAAHGLGYDYVSQDLVHDLYPMHLNNTSAHSPRSKRGFSMAEESHVTTTLPIRNLPGEDLNAKRRRLSNLTPPTTEHENNRSSDLGYSQALSSLQLQVDNFSNSLGQALDSFRGDCMDSNISIDVGVLLPIADRFMALVSQLYRESISWSLPIQTTTHPSMNTFNKPNLDRSQTEPDSTTMENMINETRAISAALIQPIFTCHARLLFAFSIALDVISHNLSNADMYTSTSNHPVSSIGSYTLPESSSLSTLLHLHAISHSLDRLDATLRKVCSIDALPNTDFFDGIFCRQRRHEMALTAYIERAFEDASQQKNCLMTRVRGIVASVAAEDEI